jgi:hypothetical protein
MFAYGKTLAKNERFKPKTTNLIQKNLKLPRSPHLWRDLGGEHRRQKILEVEKSPPKKATLSRGGFSIIINC